ncbi:hypothetical protein Tco_1228928 [Tanacetum coccineum]
MKVIKEGSEKLGLFKIDDDSFASNSPLGITFDEFNRLSRIDDDLFTYEVEIPGLPTIPSDTKEEDDSDDGDLVVYEPRVCYDENDKIYAEAVIFVNKKLVRLMDVTIEQYMDLMYGDHEKVDVKVKEEVISKWIETNIFDFETPICKTFNEFNYLLKINTDLFTRDILRFKTYDELKNEWMNEWNKGIPWAPEEPWSENGIPIDDIHYICEPKCFKNGKAKWPSCNSNEEGLCNGGELPGMVRVGYMTYFKDYEGYDDLVDRKLKEEALKQKAIYERTFNNHEGWNDEKDILEEREPNNDHGIDNLDNDLVRDNTSYHANKEEYEENRCELLGNTRQEPSV